MGLVGYAFIDLTNAQKIHRRESLDFHAALAQTSVAIVLAAVQLYFLVQWIFQKYSKGDEERRPGSPYKKHNEELSKGSWRGKIVSAWRKLCWWLGEDFILGTRGEWLLGVGWALWLGVLCVRETGEDYMHLTKRFGIIGASQLPLHYLLAMKTPFNPIQRMTRLSHEQLNAFHQILGRIIQTLLTLHALFYLNFFVRLNVFSKRAKDPDVILGLICISIFTMLGTSALRFVRRVNYRIFYTVHVAGAVSLLPLLFFHVHHVRPFVVESAIILIISAFFRWLHTKEYSGTISLIPGTSLVKVTVPFTGPWAGWKPLRWNAGQHVYLHKTSAPGNSKVLGRLRTNPFTMASLPQWDEQIVLVARVLNGNTKQLAATARTAEFAETSTRPLMLEGPYGVSAYLPDFSIFDRVLLVAGGVGATFIVPLWRSIIYAKEKEEGHAPKDGNIRLIWAVRTLAETSWAFPSTKSSAYDPQSREEKEIYVTGANVSSNAESSEETIEMAETANLVDGNDETAFQGQGIIIKRRRPDLREAVDEIFSGHVGKIAVVVCGPTMMNKQVRKEVGRWVYRGKDVFFHAEAFGL